MAEVKKYYWLKLKKDFFKRHDIQIIEAMENGKDYILFYLKMLVESVDHNGNLRFNDTIPYNEKMLSTITNTNIDIVRSAMKVFMDLNMIEILEDQTIYMLEVEKMLGTETYWAEQKRKQRLALSEKIKEIGQSPEDVLELSNVSNQEIEIDIEKDIEINKDKEKIIYIDLKFIDDCIDKVKLTQEQYDKLINKFPKDLVNKTIISLDTYIANGTKKYKDHYRTLNNWCMKNKTNTQSTPNVNKQYDAFQFDD
jgi:predicted phage replisome organizer